MGLFLIFGNPAGIKKATYPTNPKKGNYNVLYYSYKLSKR